MNRNPKISVIVPVYKVEQYLSLCIESILSQSFVNFELLLIDDGSPDNCGKICDDYALKDNRIRVFHQKNKGVSQARNLGLDEAQGDWIAFVDSDDRLHNKAFQILVSHASDDIDIVKYSHATERVFNSSFIESQYIPETCSLKESIDKNIRFAFVWECLFKREIVDKYNLRFSEEIKYGEDQEFCCKFMMHANTVQVYNIPLYCYVLRSDSAMGTRCRTEKINSLKRIKMIIEYSDDLRSESLNEFLLKTYYYWILDFFCAIIRCSFLRDNFTILNEDYREIYPNIIKCGYSVFLLKIGLIDVRLMALMYYLMHSPSKIFHRFHHLVFCRND